MTTGLRRGFTALMATVTATGLLYFWMKYLLVTDDPLALVNHPFQPLMLKLHLLAGPALLVVFGIVFNAHVATHIKKRKKRVPLRPSGLWSLLTFGLMATSAYLLPLVVDDRAHLALLWLHIGSGVIFTASYTVHVVAGLRVWRGVSAKARPVSA